MKKVTHFFMTMLLIVVTIFSSLSVFAAGTEGDQIDMLDYVVYREDGTIRETGTIPNGKPKTRWNWSGGVVLCHLGLLDSMR